MRRSRRSVPRTPSVATRSRPPRRPTGARSRPPASRPSRGRLRGRSSFARRHGPMPWLAGTTTYRRPSGDRRASSTVSSVRCSRRRPRPPSMKRRRGKRPARRSATGGPPPRPSTQPIAPHLPPRRRWAPHGKAPPPRSLSQIAVEPHRLADRSPRQRTNRQGIQRRARESPKGRISGRIVLWMTKRKSDATRCCIALSQSIGALGSEMISFRTPTWSCGNTAASVIAS